MEQLLLLQKKSFIQNSVIVIGHVIGLAVLHKTARVLQNLKHVWNNLENDSTRALNKSGTV